MLMVVWVVMWHTPDLGRYIRTCFLVEQLLPWKGISLVFFNKKKRGSFIPKVQRCIMIFYFRKYKIRGHFNIQTSIWFQFIWWFHDFISVAKKCIFIDYLCINNAPHAENINDVRSFIIHRGGISECLDFTFNVLNRLL